MQNQVSYQLDNRNPQARKRFIQQLFDAIVPTYDLLNRILSMGVDMLWRRNMLRHVKHWQGKNVLDLCCGTGDLSLLLRRQGARVVALDFSWNMLRRGRAKKALPDRSVAADASLPPFRSRTFAVATVAFGIRNIPDIDTFMQAVARVLVPGGTFIILELTRPPDKMVRSLYALYLDRILPLVGGVVSGRPLAYRYLSRTIATFVEPGELQQMLTRHGFGRVRHYPQTLGIATITVARKELS